MADALALAGKRALVSGSGKGIGFEIALELARCGADVAVHYSRDATGAANAVAQIEAFGRRSQAFRADFAVVDEVQALGRDAVEFLGGLDILVNNAGITWNREFGEVTPEQFDRIYAVNVTSIHAYAGFAGHSVYAGTKGAIVAWTRELAIELAPEGVRVNAIAPGSVQVDAYYGVDPNFDPDEAGKGIPCGFVGQPADIASLAAFLASDRARFIVGQTIVADGGTTSWMPFGEGYRNRVGGQFGQGYVPGT